MEAKAWWKSKTLWTNVVAVIGAAALAAVSTITPTTAAGFAGLAALNVILRAITGRPLGR